MEMFSIMLNVNKVYIILSILGFITSFLYLYFNNKRKNIPIVLLLYILVMLLTFTYFDYVFNSVFNFSFSSVKFYLVMLIIINIITLVTVNCNINIVNKIINWILFISSAVLFAINAYILIGNIFEFTSVEVSSIIYFIDVNVIIFIGYLIISCSIYIIKRVWKEIINYINRIKYKNRRSGNDAIVGEEVDGLEESGLVNSTSEIVNQANIIVENNKFIIDGKDCSFIFNDTNRENVVRNYYILLTDVNARLVNGYTLDENIRINNILNRLNIKNIHNVDLMNMEILSKITIDEYNLLKGYLDNCKSI